MAKAAKPIPDGYHSITPQLTLDNAAQAIDWYKKALGARQRLRLDGPGGTVAHCELGFGDAVLMLGSPMPLRRSELPFPTNTPVASVRAGAERTNTPSADAPFASTMPVIPVCPAGICTISVLTLD